jgi:hypothetical protein
MSDINFIFVRDRKNFPVGCFAYSEMIGSDGSVQGLSFGYSIFFMGETLGVKDVFSKARGRSVAEGRLLKKARTFNGSRDEILSTDELVIGMLRWCADAGYHLWAFKEDDNPRALGHRFMSACNRTAAKLEGVLKRKREAA